MIIKKDRFLNGFNMTQFRNDILNSSFSTKYQNRIVETLDKIEIKLSEELEQDEETELDTIIDNFVKVDKSELELKAEHLRTAPDYLKEREYLKTLITDFSTLTDKEKELSARYCLVDDATIVAYYVGQGLTQAQAITKHLVRRANDINKAKETCYNRSNSSVCKYIVIKHMDESVASQFFADVKQLSDDYAQLAHMGIRFNQGRDGIIDFLEATNSYVDAGLKNYTIKTGYTYEQCIDELVNYFVSGTIPSEYTDNI